MVEIRELAATINEGVPGWVTKNDQFISPFTAPFPGLHSGPRCAVTGRPVLRLSPNIVFTVTRVIPPVALEARNPLVTEYFLCRSETKAQRMRKFLYLSVEVSSSGIRVLSVLTEESLTYFESQFLKMLSSTSCGKESLLLET